MPNRILREALRLSRKVSELTDREHRLFILLMTVADDYGRFRGDPQIILGACYTYGTITLATLTKTMDGLAAKGMIDIYEGPDGDGKVYLEILQFDQRLRSKDSKYPQNPNPRSSAADRRLDGGVCVVGGVCEDGDGQTSVVRGGHGASKAGIPRRILVTEFEESAWPPYPRKEGKASALDDFIKARRSGEALAVIAAGVNAYASHIKASGTEPRYVKQGGTWFHQKGWLDDYSSNGATGRRKLRRAE